MAAPDFFVARVMEALVQLGEAPPGRPDETFETRLLSMMSFHPTTAPLVMALTDRLAQCTICTKVVRIGDGVPGEHLRQHRLQVRWILLDKETMDMIEPSWDFPEVGPLLHVSTVT